MALPPPRRVITFDTEAAANLTRKAFSTIIYEGFLEELVTRALTSSQASSTSSLVEACEYMAKYYREAVLPLETPAPKKKTRSKKERDPNMPKRPLTAYMFFSKDITPYIKQQYPSLTFGELGTLIAARWAKLSGEEREPYYRSARDDKERYDKAMNVYVKT